MDGIASIIFKGKSIVKSVDLAEHVLYNMVAETVARAFAFSILHSHLRFRIRVYDFAFAFTISHSRLRFYIRIYDFAFAFTILHSRSRFAFLHPVHDVAFELFNSTLAFMLHIIIYREILFLVVCHKRDGEEDRANQSQTGP